MAEASVHHQATLEEIMEEDNLKERREHLSVEVEGMALEHTDKVTEHQEVNPEDIMVDLLEDILVAEVVMDHPVAEEVMDHPVAEEVMDHQDQVLEWDALLEEAEEEEVAVGHHTIHLRIHPQDLINRNL